MIFLGRDAVLICSSAVSVGGNSVLCTFFFGASTFLTRRESSLMTGGGRELPAAIIDSMPRLEILLHVESIFSATGEGSSKSCLF